MANLILQIRSAGLRAVVAVTALGLGASAAGELAQDPLLVKNIQVVPNIMYTLDDSPSMESISGGLDRDLRLHPAEHALDKPAGVIPTEEGILYAAQMRNATTNPFYYDPKVRYLPWAKSDGTLNDPIDPTAAPLRPLATGSAVVNLTVAADYNTNWCEADPADVTTVCPKATRHFQPATYFIWNKEQNTFTRIPIMETAAFAKHPDRTDCAGAAACTQAEELKNFANWFSYYRTRMLTAIAGTTRAFSRLDSTARIGWGSLNNSATWKSIDPNGAHVTETHVIRRGIRLFAGQDRKDFFDWIYDFNLSGMTPTKRAVAQVGAYFQRKDYMGPWGARPFDPSEPQTSQVSCRRNFHVLVSDGIWNSSSKAPGWNYNFDAEEGPELTSASGAKYKYTPVKPYADNTTWKESGTDYHSLADITFYFWSRDLRDDLKNNLEPTPTNPAFWQHLTHFMVGLGVSGSLKKESLDSLLAGGNVSWGTSQIDDLHHAAINSRGEYLNVRKADEFGDRLSALMNAIATTASLAGVSTSTRDMKAGARKYVPELTSGAWSGDLKAYELDTNGDATSAIPVWSAASKLPTDHAQRNIVFNNGQAARPFVWSELSAAQKAQLGSEAALNFIRGDRSLENSSFRKRVSVLGDIVNSTPLFVKDTVDLKYDFLPTGTPGKDSYRGFLKQNAARTGAVIVGANDGMLHVFQETGGQNAAGDGVERFAFIPNALLPKLKHLSELGYQHRMYVDGPLVEGHAFLDGNWKSVVVGSAGAGARSVFALNATNPVNMGATDVLWELSGDLDPDVGHVLASAAVGMVASGKWVAIVGNGEESQSKRAKLLVIDLATGALLRKIDTGVGTAASPNGLSGVRPIFNDRRQIVGAYAGDLQGNLWKFDLSAAEASAWSVATGAALYQARSSNDQPQPITAAPIHLPHPSGGAIVVFGTGKLSMQDDLLSPVVQTIYGFWDRPPIAGEPQATVVGRTQLVQQSHAGTAKVTVDGAELEYFLTTQNEVNWSTKRGWYLDLTAASGQRVIYQLSQLFGKVLVDTIYLKNADEQCAARSSGGINYVLEPLTGAMPGKAVLDVNADGVFNSTDFAIGAYKTSGDGVNATIVARGRGAKIVSTGAKARTINSTYPVRRAWRQIATPF